ncbi:MAG: hypothetical protein M3Y50_18365 [Acidobacteriota bacterium]|nr:hypothetical protein [Acidobacteriota bacterium]
MTGNYFAPLSGSKRNRLALLAASTIFVTGCANMATSSPDVNPFSSAATLKGAIHGGNQPVAGATVSLWYAGQSISGSAQAPVLAATTTSSNDGTGSFSFVKDPDGQTSTGNHFSCPLPATESSPLVFVIAKGGNTVNDGDTSKNNTAAAFIGIYGDCGTLNGTNNVVLSEATTVATLAAIQQFFDPATETIRNDGTGQQKTIVDQVTNTIALLADVTTGTAKSTTSIAAAAHPINGLANNINPSVSITATPETSKINLIANILSSCINNASASNPQCTSLFSAAVPPAPNVTNLNPNSFAAATDTLQAAFYMLVNPSSSNTANMTTLYGLAGGVGAPYQPSLSTQPTDWTIGISYSSSSPCGTPTGGTGAFVSSPVDIAIDQYDDVWFANSQGSTGNLSAITSSGVPLACIFPGAGAQGGTVIDSASNVWVGTSNSMYRYTTYNGAALSFPIGTSPLAVAADGVKNLYFTSVSGTTGSLYQIPLAATATAAVAPVQISNAVGPNPIRIMPDYITKATLNNLWVTSGSSFVSKVTPGTGSGSLNSFLTTPFTTSGNSYGLSVNQAGNIYIAANDTNALTTLVPSGGTFVQPSGSPFAGAAAGVSHPTSISLDSRSNIWLPNNTNGASTGSVSEISAYSNALSPSTGFQKAQSYLLSGRALAVDQSGNVWVAGDGANFITEIVGSAAPIYQPYAVGLANGRFQTVP